MTEITCDEVLEDLELYIDGELDPLRAERLAEHLSGCSPCLRRAEFKSRLRELVRHKCREEAPRHVVLRMRTVIRSRRMGPPDPT